MTKVVKVKRTESEMLALLRARYGEVGGNGQAFAFVTGVRSAAGFDAKRTLDGITMGLWPSRGLLLDGFEVKCSRSDWQRELKKPEKAEEFCRMLDRFWIVAGDADIVREGELPPDWGLLVAQGDRLVSKVDAKMLHDYPESRSTRPLPPGLGRSFLACLMREAVRVGGATPAEITQAVEEALTQERASRERRSRSDREVYEPMYTRLQKDVREFEQELGVPIRGFAWNGEDPGSVGRVVRTALRGEHDYSALQGRLRGLADQAERIAAEANQRADTIEATRD